MGLQAVDDGVVSPQHLHDVGGALLPDEERAVVGTGHDVLPVAASDTRGLRLFIDLFIY